ncbi:hypothetical protein ACFLUY_00835 [Chloroflexota bacterium]
MKCFQHPEKEAIGVCQTCGKGVCRDCYLEDGGVLYCSKACAPESSRLHVLGGRIFSSIIVLLFGITLLVWFLTDYLKYEVPSEIFTLGFAVIMFLAFMKALAGR